jgi:hypothetical protein
MDPVLEGEDQAGGVGGPEHFRENGSTVGDM